MMKRLFALWLLLLVFSTSALAQESTAVVASPPTPSPAAYLPSDIPAYFEVRTDSVGLAAFNQLTALGFQLNGMPASQPDMIDTLLTPAFSSIFPGIDLRRDVLPWLGDTIGDAILQSSDPEHANESVIVLPIRNLLEAEAFFTRIGVNATPNMIGDIITYKTATFGLALGSDVMWLSSPSGLDTFLKLPMFQRLTDNPRYQKVRAALPADAVLSAYVSGSFLAAAAADMEANQPPSMPSFAAIVEAALRLHPAKSAAEDALLKWPSLDGVGFALQVSDGQLDATAILSLNANYPAPTLTTATAGTALLSLIPGDSFAVLDSYDPSVTVLPFAGLALLGPSIGSIFDNIVADLNSGESQPTPTPTPSPTPTPPLTADAIIAQVQPLLAQAQSTLGLSLDELYSLIDGEYTVAIFPGEGPTLGAALYLQSSDPQKIIDTLDHTSKLILTDPTTGAQLVTPTHSTVDGVDVVLVGEQGVSDRPALGILPNDVLFLTMESTLTKVIEAAKNQSPATPALNWRDSFGDAQEALLYLDPQTVDLYVTRSVRNPPLPISAVAASFDVRDNGLFVLHLTATTGS